MTADWKKALVSGLGNDGLPMGYRREGRIVGRAELLDATDRHLWVDSEFVARAKTPHTTSALEAGLRRRHLERLVNTFGIDRGQLVLELGCADGLVTRHLLELGFEKLVSTDIDYPSVATLDRALTPAQRERVLLVLDDMLRLPLERSSVGAVVAWGVLSVSGDFERALDRSWQWVTPGGYLLLAEPLLESVLLYALVRGDLEEFRRTQREGTRAAMWETREDRYRVNSLRFYTERLKMLSGATVEESGGVSMLPSLIFGGVLQDSPVGDEELAELADLLSDPKLDDLALWRQAFWLVRKA